MESKVDESHWHPSEPHKLQGKNLGQQWREGLEKLNERLPQQIMTVAG